VALPFTFLKKYLKAKEELWKIQIFHHTKIKSSNKINLLNKTKNSSRYHNSTT
jgi:hypothetical protein